MTSAGTPLRRSAGPGWYGSGCPTRASAGPSVLASWTAPSASASHSRGLASDEDWAGARRLKRTLAPGSLSLARLSMSFRISAKREGVILLASGQWLLMLGTPGAAGTPGGSRWSNPGQPRRLSSDRRGYPAAVAARIPRGDHELSHAAAGHLPGHFEPGRRPAGDHDRRAHRLRPGLHRRRRRRPERA